MNSPEMDEFLCTLDYLTFDNTESSIGLDGISMCENRFQNESIAALAKQTSEPNLFPFYFSVIAEPPSPSIQSFFVPMSAPDLNPAPRLSLQRPKPLAGKKVSFEMHSSEDTPRLTLHPLISLPLLPALSPFNPVDPSNECSQVQYLSASSCGPCLPDFDDEEEEMELSSTYLIPMKKSKVN